MNIGITLDLQKPFWSNGLQQNIVFLYDVLSRIPETACYYITCNTPAQKLAKPHEAILLDEVLGDDSFKLDVLIIVGFDLAPAMYDSLKKRNPHLKVILIHYGNKLMDDIHHSIAAPSSRRSPLQKPKHLSQIWISPHHAFSKEYVKAYYNFENVAVAPYVWDSFFVQGKLKELALKNLSPSFRKENVGDVCIFEPNISHIKNCIVPFVICERAHQLHPGSVKSVNISSCEGIRKKPYFESLMNRLTLIRGGKESNNNNCYFNNRWGSLTALSKWGSTIVSHQIYNELNYSHLEALYLGLPLIHNSPLLIDVGYYYPDCDVTMGAHQLYSATLNHNNTLDKYKGDAQRFLYRYSALNPSNIDGYKLLVRQVLEKK